MGAGWWMLGCLGHAGGSRTLQHPHHPAAPTRHGGLQARILLGPHAVVVQPLQHRQRRRGSPAAAQHPQEGGQRVGRRARRAQWGARELWRLGAGGVSRWVLVTRWSGAWCAAPSTQMQCQHPQAPSSTSLTLEQLVCRAAQRCRRHVGRLVLHTRAPGATVAGVGPHLVLHIRIRGVKGWRGAEHLRAAAAAAAGEHTRRGQCGDQPRLVWRGQHVHRPTHRARRRRRRQGLGCRLALAPPLGAGAKEPKARPHLDVLAAPSALGRSQGAGPAPAQRGEE